MQSPELALELRSARPLASAALRVRVLAVAAQEAPARERRSSRPSLRRLALVAVAAALALVLGSALVYGIAKSGSPSRLNAELGRSATMAGAQHSGAPGAKRAVATAKPPDAAGSLAPAPPRAPGRLQRYGASLRIQVKDVAALSDATKRAMRFARGLGGYVAYVRYTTPARGGGAAALIVRVPIDRVQDAIQEYSSLGTILAQNVSVLDVTKQVEEQAKEIARLQAEIVRLEAGTITPAVRARIDAARARLDYLTRRKAATLLRAQLARIALELTTKPKLAAATSRFQRTLGDAGGVLLREAEIVLYALIVAGPLLVLGAAAIAGTRFTQRRRESQLLERS